MPDLSKQIWTMEKSACYPGNTEKKFAKVYKQAIANTLANLETYKATLEEGVHPEQAKRMLAFVHEEKKGLIAIDQRPPKNGVQIRLYVFSDLNSRKILIIAIGDKRSQESDIKFAYKIIEEYKNGQKNNENIGTGKRTGL